MVQILSTILDSENSDAWTEIREADDTRIIDVLVTMETYNAMRAHQIETGNNETVVSQNLGNDFEPYQISHTKIFKTVTIRLYLK